ncbi:Hexokinase [Clonorchis sinensis]|uniref:Phosphotransferase n=2 Tax=Clonorchis sinensis TaxID=79923 RepID=H2KV01_CLOSI|nr:Hexokinase [Clonorchis sinensis]GAA30542.2 hexokinase [Clonorchis sinensis]
MAACAAKDPECAIGLIVSTGMNCCYFEKAARINRPFAKFAAGGELIINTECGGFGSYGSMDQFITKYDKMVDESSVAPGKQILEKMVSTLYIGELARLVILEATEKKLLFNGHLPERLAVVNSFTSQFLFDIDRDPPHVYMSTEVVLRERFKITCIQKMDMVNIRFICRALVTRSGNMVGAIVACLINRMGRHRTTIGVDGAFFRFSSMFPAILVETVTRLIPYSYTFKLKLIDDGTGKGAAAIIGATKAVVIPAPRFTVFRF